MIAQPSSTASKISLCGNFTNANFRSCELSPRWQRISFDSTTSRALWRNFVAKFRWIFARTKNEGHRISFAFLLHSIVFSHNLFPRGIFPRKLVEGGLGMRLVLAKSLLQLPLSSVWEKLPRDEVGPISCKRTKLQILKKYQDFSKFTYSKSWSSSGTVTLFDWFVSILYFLHLEWLTLGWANQTWTDDKA